ncbi:hypothetical protein SLA2020_192780 [Shorea laevis]
MVLGRPLFPPFHGRPALCNTIKAKGQMKILLPSSDHLLSSGTLLGLCKAQKGSHLACGPGYGTVAFKYIGCRGSAELSSHRQSEDNS